VILYAESSAVLTWVLSQERESEIESALSGAELIISSDLTMLECERVLVRGNAVGELSDAELTRRQVMLRTAGQHWMLLGFDPSAIERAQRPYPNEPIRTLDALQLAFALAAGQMIPDVRILTLDRRLRKAARELGMEIYPESDQPA
jgi:predicted nucleic acid-binding protein